MKGTYTLILECKKPLRVKFGRLGSASLPAGFYLYTGSARGRGAMSLERRLARHRRHEKARKWHVDYITTRSQCQLRGAVYVVGKRALECKINRLLCMAIGTQLILPHLGSSDCTCKAHLVGIERSISRRELVRQLEYAYSTFGTPRFYGVN